MSTLRYRYAQQEGKTTLIDNMASRAKGWVNLNQTGQTIYTSWNIASITDSALGNTLVVLTTPFIDTNNVGMKGVGQWEATIGSYNTGIRNFGIGGSTVNGTALDVANASMVYQGTLA